VEAGVKIATAKKYYRCTECSRKIPAGHRYWSEYSEIAGVVTMRQHTNCEDYLHEEVLEPNFKRVKA